MTQERDRATLIGEIERARDSRVLSFVTGDRQQLSAMIAGDVLPLAYEHLRAIGHVREITLFLYTQGGDSLAGWGLVNMIREYCDRFVVMAPFRCYSCGTLIALGADEVIVTPGTQLSPVDPSVASPYNPAAPNQGGPQVQLLPVSIEDLLGYLNLVTQEVGLRDEGALGRILETLSEKVHPMALGAVYRAKEQVAFLARQLLMNHFQDVKQIDVIIEHFTKMPSHSYIVGRREAQRILGDDFVLSAEEAIETLMVDLYNAYRDWMQLSTPYSPENELGHEQQAVRTFPRAVFESMQNGALRTHVFRTRMEINTVQVTQPNVATPIVGMQQRVLAEGWTRWPEGVEGT